MKPTRSRSWDPRGCHRCNLMVRHWPIDEKPRGPYVEGKDSSYYKSHKNGCCACDEVDYSRVGKWTMPAPEGAVQPNNITLTPAMNYYMATLGGARALGLQDKLREDDLVSIKGNTAIRPRPATAASIPGMLTLLQSEWDALMSETFELKLYQHDAACRVIARLIRERDMVKAQNQKLQEELSSAPLSGAIREDADTGITPEILQKMKELADSLSKTRKQKHFPDLNPLTELKKFKCVGTHPIHKSTEPGILCVDVHKTEQHRVVTGGVDTQAVGGGRGGVTGCRCEQRNDWARSVKSPVETAALAFCEAALKKKATKGGKKEDSVPPVSVCEEQLSNRKATGAYGRLHTVLQEAPKTAAWHLTRVCRDECEELVNMTNRNMGKMQSDLHGAWTPHVMSVGETCAMRVVKKVEAEIFGCCGRSCGWNGRSCISWPFFDEQQKADWQAECCTEYNVLKNSSREQMCNSVLSKHDTDLVSKNDLSQEGKDVAGAYVGQDLQLLWTQKGVDSEMGRNYTWLEPEPEAGEEVTEQLLLLQPNIRKKALDEGWFEERELERASFMQMQDTDGICDPKKMETCTPDMQKWRTNVCAKQEGWLSSYIPGAKCNKMKGTEKLATSPHKCFEAKYDKVDADEIKSYAFQYNTKDKENPIKCYAESGQTSCTVVLFDSEKGGLVQKLTGHAKKVTSVCLHPTKDVVVSGSSDASAKVWTCTGPEWTAAYTCAHTVRKHQAEVTEISIHPLGDYFLTTALDKSWAMHDLHVGRCVKHLRGLETSYPCMKWHPDGMILAAGTQGHAVDVWDIKDWGGRAGRARAQTPAEVPCEQKVVATLTGHQGSVEALSFSGNGYYLATGSKDGTVKLWDLRKPLNIQTLQLESPVNTVAFDTTGQYLSVGAEVVQIYNFASKSSLTEAVTLKDHGDAVMGVCFSQHARSLATVSMDRTLKIFRA
eukprot:g22295.t2